MSKRNHRRTIYFETQLDLTDISVEDIVILAKTFADEHNSSLSEIRLGYDLDGDPYGYTTVRGYLYLSKIETEEEANKRVLLEKERAKILAQEKLEKEEKAALAKIKREKNTLAKLKRKYEQT